MKNQSKKFFYIACAAGILLFCSYKIHRNWQRDEFYTKEFQRSFAVYMGSKQLWLQKTQLSNTLKEIERKMICEGYSYSEAGSIREQALKEAGLVWVTAS